MASCLREPAGMGTRRFAVCCCHFGEPVCLDGFPGSGRQGAGNTSKCLKPSKGGQSNFHLSSCGRSSLVVCVCTLPECEEVTACITLGMRNAGIRYWDSPRNSSLQSKFFLICADASCTETFQDACK